MGSLFQLHKKTIIIIVVAFLGILFFTFCLFWINNVIYNKQYRIVPQNFPGTVWKSKDECICLNVPEEESQRITGTITINSKVYDIYLSTTAGSGALIMDNLCNKTLMKVDCIYSEEQIIMKINEDRVGNWEKKTIVLYRTE